MPTPHRHTIQPGRAVRDRARKTGSPTGASHALVERVGTLAQALGAARALPAICGPLADFVLAMSPGSGLFVSLFDAERRERTAVYAWSEGAEVDVSALPPLPLNDSPASRAIATGRLVVTDDLQAAVANLPAHAVGTSRNPRAARSSVAVPMAVQGRVIGAFEVQGPRRAGFQPSHLIALRMAANLAAVAVENLRALDRERALQMARERERLKDELLSTVSHELRTPLAALVGFSELLLTRDYGEAERREFLGIMLKEGQRLAGLVDDILDVQRLRSGRLVLHRSEVDLRDSVEAAWNRLGASPDHALVLVVPPTLPAVLADPDRLHQVLVNLLSNARKYSPGGGTITVQVTPGDVQLEVAVADRGLGVPAGALPHLFEDFYRVERAEQHEIAGSGLGLAICKKIVEAHDGTIRAESAGPGRGTTVRFTLPLAPAPATVREADAPVRPGRAASTAPATARRRPPAPGQPPPARRQLGSWATPSRPGSTVPKT